MGHHHDHAHDGTAKAASVTLLVNIALTVMKWTAFAVTGSPSLFGEAAHSTADTANPLLLWFGYRRSGRPAHDRHPLGHGREAFFWSLVAAQMMLLVGSGLTAAHGIHALRSGEPPAMSAWALGLVGVALLGEGYSLFRSLRGARHGLDGKGAGSSKNTVLLALVVENSADMAGVLLAVAGYGMYLLTGNPVWDALFSLAIAAMLAGTSLFLIRRNLSLITGESAPRSVHEDVARTLREHPSVGKVDEVIVVMAGPDRMACRVTVRLDRVRLLERWAGTKTLGLRPEEAVIWTADDIARERDRIVRVLRERYPNMVDITVICR